MSFEKIHYKGKEMKRDPLADVYKIRDRGRLKRWWCFFYHVSYHECVKANGRFRWMCNLCQQPFYKKDLTS